MYPALAVLEALESEDAQVLWVGSLDGMESDLVKREGIPFTGIPAAGVHGVSLRALPGNLAQIVRGWWAARRVIRNFKPDVMFFTGGYVAVPVALAGLKVPTVLYVPDVEPGLALKLLTWFSDHIAVTREATRAFFGRRVRSTVTGYPTRKGLKTWSRSAGTNALNLLPDLPTLLVFGGSKGARSINSAVLDILDELLPEMQIVHISGKLDWERVDLFRQEIPEGLQDRYHAFPYLYEEMGAALVSADLVVSRAGASALGEFPQFGLPAILVPYPYAWQYQKVNALALVDSGGAVLLEDSLLENRLLSTIQDLLTDKSQLESMRRAMEAMAQPQAAQEIASILISIGSLSAKRGKTDG